ncbi:hypothetical protein Sango_3076800 [Sesamum angolense]|uniref:DDE Tnp4 domain-containing protein n=1 Tax=Sesamum angolense TaxID=2727404 RepID=A0AAE1VYU8_9LAMI|nr:hypothetical protein Sango_3076800 [Sesamum angolense]
MHTVLLAKPTLITDDYPDPCWKRFKMVPSLTCKYQNMKRVITTHVKGKLLLMSSVSNSNIQFIYILSGWEGNAADNCVLQDAIHRSRGLHVPVGNYYLCDIGYINAEVF